MRNIRLIFADLVVLASRHLSVIMALFLAAGLSVATGCGDAAYPKVPADGIGFSYPVTYEGREYYNYGDVNYLKTKYIDKCIGYIVEYSIYSSKLDPENKDTRVYTLKADPDHNLLLIVYTNEGICAPPPAILRADDTKDKDIEIPEYVENLYYEFWGEEQEVVHEKPPKGYYIPELPADPVVFEMKGWQSGSNYCETFIHNGREYLFYTMVDKLKEKDVAECLGTTSFEGEERNKQYVIRLNNCENDDYIALYTYNEDPINDEVELYRAADTRDMDLDAPVKIDSLFGYNMTDYWDPEM